MWPWEHAALGYLLVSLATRATRGRPPDEAAVVAVLVGTQLPDLVDKPLSWGLGVFPTGHGVGHSVFAGVAVGALAWRARRHREPVLALALGYWSHLAGDALDPLRDGGGIAVERLLWPVVRAEPYARDYGLARGLVYLREFAGGLSAGDPAVVVSLAAPAAGLALWLVDGAPGLGAVRRLTRAGRRRLLPPGGRR